MAATKPALASGGITPLPIAVGLEDVFFRVLPIVLSLAFSTMFNSTTFSSSRRKLQRANPTGAGEQVRAINFASAAPSKIRGRAEFGLYLRASAAAIPSSTSRRRVRPILLMLVSNAAEIALSLQPSPASDTSAFRRMRAFVSDCAGCLPAQIIVSSCSRSSALSFTTYFLTEISLPATNHLHRRIAATEIQRNSTDSMTLAILGSQRRIGASGSFDHVPIGVRAEAIDQEIDERPNLWREMSGLRIDGAQSHILVMNSSSVVASAPACKSDPTMKVGRFTTPRPFSAAILKRSPLLALRSPLTSTGQGLPSRVANRHSCEDAMLLLERHSCRFRSSGVWGAPRDLK